MSSEHLVLAATQSMTMPSSPPTRGATPAQVFHPIPQSANPPNLHYPQPLMPVSTSLNDFIQQQENTTPTSAPDPNSEVDPQIVEALKSKDRIFVLKCGELMENLVREHSKARVEVTAISSYQRMLVHRCSSFYKTALEVDPTTKVFYISLTPESCVPERKISDLVPLEPAQQPAFKIMQRTQDRKPKSQTNSVAGDDAELSDLEPSETGSLGGKSSSTTGHTKKRPTIEEREAAYKEARSRIFLGFEEKEKGSMNSSCSSLSLTSSSAGAGSSAGDLDDTSSPATESEWPPSNPRENKKEFRRGSGASSSRNGRSTFSGPAGVRNSGASSPSFKYASIYDSPQTSPYYDPHIPYPESFNHGYPPSQHPASFPPPSGHPSNLPFSPPYPYYPSYNPYQPPPQPQPHLIDGMPANGDVYPGPMAPANNFGWQNAPPAPPPQMQHPQPPPQVQPNPNQMMSLHPPPGQGPPYVPYPVPPYPYPSSGYYPPPAQMVPPYPNPAPVPSYDMSRPSNGTVGGGYGPLNQGHPANGHCANLSGSSGRNMRSTTGPNMNGTPKGRPGPTSTPTRSGWSFGPGVGGYVPPQLPGGDAVGPRLSSRRSGNPSRSSSMNDDVSSSASSSTTSSSSRRTYTSTTSSQHPLPARPDWAVAMTMAPSNHPHSRHHHHHDHPTRSIAPPRNGNIVNGSSNVPLPSSTSGPMPPLQPTDFPPLLSTIATPDRRPPNTMGAWGTTNMRSTLASSQGPQHPLPKPFLNPATLHQFDEPDRCFERPPPKSAELFNHKSGKRPPNNTVGNGRSQLDNEKEQRKNDAFVKQVGAMTIADQAPSDVISHGASQEPLKVGT